MKISIAFLALFALIWTPVWAEEVPDLVGNWTGETLAIRIGSPPHLPGITSENITYSNATPALIIEEQNGRRFSGKLVHMNVNPPFAEMIFGVISFDNETVYMVDEDGYHDGRLISPTEMELIYRKTSPENMIIGLTRYTKTT